MKCIRQIVRIVIVNMFIETGRMLGDRIREHKSNIVNRIE